MLFSLTFSFLTFLLKVSIYGIVSPSGVNRNSPSYTKCYGKITAMSSKENISSYQQLFPDLYIIPLIFPALRSGKLLPLIGQAFLMWDGRSGCGHQWVAAGQAN